MHEACCFEGWNEGLGLSLPLLNPPSSFLTVDGGGGTKNPCSSCHITGSDPCNWWKPDQKEKGHQNIGIGDPRFSPQDEAISTENLSNLSFLWDCLTRFRQFANRLK